jgi:hypothetical protein
MLAENYGEQELNFALRKTRPYDDKQKGLPIF